jgi:hypothetical protein
MLQKYLLPSHAMINVHDATYRSHDNGEILLRGKKVPCDERAHDSFSLLSSAENGGILIFYNSSLMTF